MAKVRFGLGFGGSFACMALAVAACSEAPADVSGSGGTAGSGGQGMAGALAGSAGQSVVPAGGGGAGGASAQAGAGGSQGGAPVAGTSSGGGGGGAANPGAKASAGCGKAATQALETFVEAHVTAKGFDRQYFVRLPAGYDPQRPYPTVVVAAGCGGKGDGGISIQDASKSDAIVLGLSPSAEVAGRDCFMTESPTSPEIDFFDAALAAVEAGFCVDQSRIFMEGFSSGSWLTNLIGCARGDVLRGQGNASGGPPPLPDCKGPIATIMVHDMNDDPNKYEGGVQTRNRIRELNGCMDMTAPWDPMFPECVAYQGCPAAYPLVFCTTTGKGHTENKPFSTEGFWKFWSSLPAKP